MRYLIVLSILICSICFAQNKIYIFFINGINTTPDEADANLSHLESLIKENEHISWNILYNATHGVVRSDIWDVLKQKRLERRDYGVQHYLVRNPTNTLQDYLYRSNYVGKNLGDIVEQFHDRFPMFRQESYALIISHSQGNQYANQLWDYLVNGEGLPAEHIALFGIASPASYIEGTVHPTKIDYVTANNDKVINAARFIPEKALPANTHIEDCKEVECHNFIKDYLGDNKIRSIICNQIGAFVNLWLNTQPIC